MATETPRPASARGWVAKDPHVVTPRVSATFVPPRRRPALQLVEHVFQAHDGRHGHVSRPGEAGGDKLESQPLLDRAQVARDNTAVVGRSCRTTCASLDQMGTAKRQPLAAFARAQTAMQWQLPPSLPPVVDEARSSARAKKPKGATGSQEYLKANRIRRSPPRPLICNPANREHRDASSQLHDSML